MGRDGGAESTCCVGLSPPAPEEAAFPEDVLRTPFFSRTSLQAERTCGQRGTGGAGWVLRRTFALAQTPWRGRGDAEDAHVNPGWREKPWKGKSVWTEQAQNVSRKQTVAILVPKCSPLGNILNAPLPVSLTYNRY